ncbi:sugar phosphate isomerase/epimerase family protein [Paenibacillus agricola]|uniref:TIM barrel protein n=1 Tax=Paenibacillus agricola TaxID=2716264 RepID=A0ABX0IXL1_9BACL|nr:TIM barrel protein [Paenibacillus agricola]NHN28266.1 TIM barrel protein [Paenibacillus agricola]
MAFWSINTYSLKRQLGPLTTTKWDDEKKQHFQQVEPQPEETSLLQLPGLMKEKGFTAAEVSYSQFPQTDHAYAEQVRNAFQAAGVDFASLLLDYADLSSNDPARRAADLEWCRSWIDLAAKAGAHRVRITAGKSASADKDALKRSTEAFIELSNYSAGLGIRMMTENLGKLLATSVYCREFLELCDSKVGFTADFGNFEQDKYRQLAEVLPLAETVHVKAETDESGEIDIEDFQHCMKLLVEAGFRGPLSLTYLGVGEPWSHLEQMRSLAQDVIHPMVQAGE